MLLRNILLKTGVSIKTTVKIVKIPINTRSEYCLLTILNPPKMTPALKEQKLDHILSIKSLNDIILYGMIS